MSEQNSSKPNEDTLFNLYSGMPIPDSPLRAELDEKLSAAHRVWSRSPNSQRQIKRASKLANSVGEAEGIEILREGHFGEDYRYRCDNYVFGEVLRETWAAPHSDVPTEFESSPLQFLERQGYQMVTVPMEGDIAAYTDDADAEVRSGNATFPHYAIVDRDGMAVSKWGQGPIVRHQIGTLPSSYGNSVYFFHK
jgi:hypothetical protein